MSRHRKSLFNRDGLCGFGVVLAGWLLAAATVQALPRSRKSNDSTPARPTRRRALSSAPQTRFIQVQPAHNDPASMARSAGQRSAVVLIHGYSVRFKKDRVGKAQFRDWQEAGSPLVNALAKDNDVFAFAYGQTVSLEEISNLPGLRNEIAHLKKLGYTRITLVGHSAGALIARHFVEDFPTAGVTKVVQVAPPNGGTPNADLKWVPKNQKAFLYSLCRVGRAKCLQARAGKKIPAGIQFICISTATDQVVPWPYQWTADLQIQGVPVVLWPSGHHQVVRTPAAVNKIAEVVRQPQPRWRPAQVAEVRKVMVRLPKQRAGSRD